MEDILKGSVDNHIHCCPHINKRSTNIFDVVDTKTGEVTLNHKK